MATAVPSRFAVLSIEDDDYKPKKSQKSGPPAKTGSKPKPEKPKQQQQPKKDEKKKQNKGKKKKSANESQQWEQWKEKDSMAVEETFKQEMHQAILLSKLAYEEQLVTSSKTQKDEDQNKKSGKKTKKATMSLDEFNSMAPTNTTAQTTVINSDDGETKSKELDPEFFERVEKETKEEIIKGKEKDMLKARLNKIDDDISTALLKVEVEKRDEVINQLRAEVDTLKEQLAQVKERNKNLYKILSHGEMKDKASVLAEVAMLQEVRDELTLEVVSLRVQLEQERSKTRTATTTDVKPSKQTNKKRPASKNA